MNSFLDDPRELVRSDKIYEFWPTNSQTAEERINSSARFIIYGTCILYLIRRDVRVFVLGGMCLAILSVMYRTNMIKKPIKCEKPTKVTFEEFVEDEQQVGDDIDFGPGRSRSPLPEFQRNSIHRQFIHSPTIDEQANVAEMLYGRADRGMCKTEGGAFCDPNARGAQLDFFTGLNTHGDKRT